MSNVGGSFRKNDNESSWKNNDEGMVETKKPNPGGWGNDYSNTGGEEA
jgi:hypothetical protein